MAASSETISHAELKLADRSKPVVRSEATRKLMMMVQRVAASPAAVLIQGETGSGKELVARAIHEFSVRSHKPWIDVNCSALPEHLLESELFGYEKGAFSGADSAKPGMFELANSGTLFLDEIGELDGKIQAKLLRVLDGAPYYRLGGTKKISVDVRVVAATNRNLEAAVRQGTFRKDLYYRLGQVQLQVPPLRERPEDVLGIAEQVLEAYRPDAHFSQAAADALCNYSWPGNVRELKNVVMTLATLGDFSDEVGFNDLPEQIIGLSPTRRSDDSTLAIPMGDLDSMERVMIERALQESSGDQQRAADSLGISRRTLSRKLKLYKLEASNLGSLGPQQQRYFRAELSTKVSLRSSAGDLQNAKSVNVSASGLGLHEVPDPLHLTGIIDLEFALPNSASIQAKAKITWADAQGHAGLRFVSLAPDVQRRLNLWLEERREEEGWAKFD